jgi:pSer/pThr/pTyr-binding forkhead associated (FHA) protein
MAQTTTRRDRSAMLAAAGVLGDAAAMPLGKRFTLAFLSGPYASTVRVLDKPITVIGREEGEILTMDPETSRRHAQIEVNPDAEIWLSDLGSTNGTFVDGAPIEGPVQLVDRQEFTCGKSTFMVMVRNDDTYGLS